MRSNTYYDRLLDRSPTSWCPRRPTWDGFSRPLSSFRLARNPASFALDDVMEKLDCAQVGSH